MFEKRPSIVVRFYKLYWRVIIRQVIMTCIDIFPVVLGYNSKVFVAFIDTHHVFHAVGVGFGQCAVSVPICYDADVHQTVHQTWKFNIVF
jgi:hypothetical protein